MSKTPGETKDEVTLLFMRNTRPDLYQEYQKAVIRDRLLIKNKFYKKKKKDIDRVIKSLRK